MSTPKGQTFEAICSALYQMDGLAEFLGEGDEPGVGHVGYFVFKDGGVPLMEVQVVRHEPEEQITVRRRWKAKTPDGEPGIVTVEGHFVTDNRTISELHLPTQDAVLAVLEGYRQVLSG